ncbi:MAG TPA: choice-of-anchor tandem repeat GloVer-containing protein [Rhizomicrobium sp.]
MQPPSRGHLAPSWRSWYDCKQSTCDRRIGRSIARLAEIPMFKTFQFTGKCMIGCALALIMVVLSGNARAQSYTVLHDFTGPPADGVTHGEGVIADGAGNLYGTTYFGGSKDCYCGVVFKVATDGTETALYEFKGGGDGAGPLGGLVADQMVNLYGTTQYGGGTGCTGGDFAGCGTIFKLEPDGTETVLYSFGDGSHGASPQGALIEDTAGNLYGTAYHGGAKGDGTVFRLASDGTFTVLHSFKGGTDGSNPAGGVIADAAGNLYGTTINGGNHSLGTVFRISAGGGEKKLYSFAGSPKDGANPAASLFLDASGSLYGTTELGGFGGYGTVFKIAPDGTESVLYSFANSFYGVEGAVPSGGLVADQAGNFYGVTDSGGPTAGGVLYKLAPDGTETVLHTFRIKSNGRDPTGTLLMNTSGAIYGTAAVGGTSNCKQIHDRRNRCGVVFEFHS